MLRLACFEAGFGDCVKLRTKYGAAGDMGLISYLTTVRFDLGSVADIAGDLSGLNIARPLIVTDAGVIAAGLVKRVCASAPQLRSAPVFDAVATNPTEEAVEA